MPSARPSWWHCCLLAYFRVRATYNLFDNGWGSSIVVPSKQNWLGWPLLCSCWNFWCQLWRMPASETCKTHPLCPRWTTMFPPPCQQADQAATCTFALTFKFPFLSLSLSLSLSLLLSVQCSFIARRRTSRLKKETSQPELCHNWHKRRTLFFLCVWEHYQLQSEMFLVRAWYECNLKNT